MEGGKREEGRGRGLTLSALMVTSPATPALCLPSATRKMDFSPDGHSHSRPEERRGRRGGSDIPRRCQLWPAGGEEGL